MTDDPVDLTPLGKSADEQRDRVARGVMVALARREAWREPNVIEATLPYTRPALVAATIVIVAVSAAWLNRPRDVSALDAGASMADLLRLPAPFAGLIDQRHERVGLADLLAATQGRR